MTEYRWEPYLREKHHTPYGWAPALISGSGAPEGSTTILPIGFPTAEECQTFIDQHLYRPTLEQCGFISPYGRVVSLDHLTVRDVNERPMRTNNPDWKPIYREA